MVQYTPPSNPTEDESSGIATQTAFIANEAATQTASLIGASTATQTASTDAGNPLSAATSLVTLISSSETQTQALAGQSIGTQTVQGVDETFEAAQQHAGTQTLPLGTVSTEAVSQVSLHCAPWHSEVRVLYKDHRGSVLLFT